MPTLLIQREKGDKAYEEVGHEHPLAVEVSNLDAATTRVRRVAKTFRADINVVGGGSGNIVEMSGRGLTSDKIIRVRRVFFSKPSVQATLVMRRQSTADSGGTSTNATVVPMDGREGVSALTRIKLYTAVPTVGTLLGIIWRGVVGTGDVFTEDFGGGDASELVLSSQSHTFALNVDVPVTIRGYIEWSEEG